MSMYKKGRPVRAVTMARPGGVRLMLIAVVAGLQTPSAIRDTFESDHWNVATSATWEGALAHGSSEQEAGGGTSGMNEGAGPDKEAIVKLAWGGTEARGAAFHGAPGIGLPLKLGETVIVLDQTRKDWWKGRKRDSLVEGWFPMNAVDLLGPSKPKSRPLPPPKFKHFEAVHPYTATYEGVLSLERGDVIKVPIRHWEDAGKNNGWMYGERDRDNAAGLVHRTFVEEKVSKIPFKTHLRPPPVRSRSHEDSKPEPDSTQGMRPKTHSLPVAATMKRQRSSEEAEEFKVRLQEVGGKMVAASSALKKGDFSKVGRQDLEDMRATLEQEKAYVKTLGFEDEKTKKLEARVDAMQKMLSDVEKVFWCHVFSDKMKQVSESKVSVTRQQIAETKDILEILKTLLGTTDALRRCEDELAEMAKDIAQRNPKPLPPRRTTSCLTSASCRAAEAELRQAMNNLKGAPGSSGDVSKLRDALSAAKKEGVDAELVQAAKTLLNEHKPSVLPKGLLKVPPRKAVRTTRRKSFKKAHRLSVTKESTPDEDEATECLSYVEAIAAFNEDRSQERLLQMQVGDIICVKIKENMWWYGECKRFESAGWFPPPPGYVKEIEGSEKSPPSAGESVEKDKVSSEEEAMMRKLREATKFHALKDAIGEAKQMKGSDALSQALKNAEDRLQQAAEEVQYDAPVPVKGLQVSQNEAYGLLGSGQKALPEVVQEVKVFKAIHDFKGRAEPGNPQLSFKIGDLIEVPIASGKAKNGWLRGKKRDGSEGWFPESYAEQEKAEVPTDDGTQSTHSSSSRSDRKMTAARREEVAPVAKAHKELAVGRVATWRGGERGEHKVVIMMGPIVTEKNAGLWSVRLLKPVEELAENLAVHSKDLVLEEGPMKGKVMWIINEQRDRRYNNKKCKVKQLSARTRGHWLVDVIDDLPRGMKSKILLLPENLASEDEMEARRWVKESKEQEPPGVQEKEIDYAYANAELGPREGAKKMKVATTGHTLPEQRPAAQARWHTEGTNPYFVGQKVTVETSAKTWIQAEVVLVYSPFIDPRGKNLGDKVVTEDVRNPEKRRGHVLGEGEMMIMPTEAWPTQLLPDGWTSRLEQSSQGGNRLVFANMRIDTSKDVRQTTPPLKADMQVISDYLPEEQDATLRRAIPVYAYELVKIIEDGQDSDWCIVVVLDDKTMLKTSRTGFIPQEVLGDIDTVLPHSDASREFLDTDLYDVIQVPEGRSETVGRRQKRRSVMKSQLADSVYYTAGNDLVLSGKKCKAIEQLGEKLQSAMESFEELNSQSSLEALTQALDEFTKKASEHDSLAKTARNLLHARAEEDQEKKKVALLKKLKQAAETATQIAVIASAIANAEREMPEDKDVKEAVEEAKKKRRELLEQGTTESEAAVRAKLQEALTKKITKKKTRIRILKEAIYELEHFVRRDDRDDDQDLKAAKERLQKLEGKQSKETPPASPAHKGKKRSTRSQETANSERTDDKDLQIRKRLSKMQEEIDEYIQMSEAGAVGGLVGGYAGPVAGGLSEPVRPKTTTQPLYASPKSHQLDQLNPTSDQLYDNPKSYQTVRMMVAKYACMPESDDELSFMEGDRIQILRRQAAQGWLFGRKDDGSEGFVPKNHLEEARPA